MKWLTPLLVWLPLTTAVDFEAADGREVMDEVYRRHQQYPYVYEEQSMILIDRQEKRETRSLRRYSRVNEAGDANLLLLFDTPSDVEGVALLAKRSDTGDMSQQVYLPAYGDQLIRSADTCLVACGDNFLGTDFSIESLVGESLDSYRYERGTDLTIEETPYFVIEVFVPEQDNNPTRRHYITQDTFVITRTDHLDQLGRINKRQTFHDLTRVHGDMWRANMILMENKLDNHRSVIMIRQRVFSSDYVPEEVFTREWILRNQPPTTPDENAELAAIEGVES